MDITNTAFASDRFRTIVVMASTVDVQFVVITESMAITSAMRKTSNLVNASIATILGAPSINYLETHSLKSSGLRSKSTSISEPSKPSGSNGSNGSSGSSGTNGTIGTNERSEPNDSNDSNESNESSARSVLKNGNGDSTVSTVTIEVSETEKETLASLDSLEKMNQTESSNEVHGSLNEISTPETTLILNFGAIRQAVINRTVETLNSHEVMKPFLEVIKSPLVSGHITSLALSSIEKFLVLGILSPKTPHIARCINEVIYALCHCRFEASDRTSDDAVMIQLMLLTDKIISSQCKSLLTAKSIGRVVETCMNMISHLRRGDMMRRTVLNTYFNLVQTVFADYSNPEFQQAANNILSILVRALNPDQLRTTNSFRITMLDVLKTCFEVGGTSFADNDALIPIMQTLWKNLAQLIRTNNYPQLVRESLLMVATIMNTTPKRYKNEFGFIILYVLTSLTPLADLPRDDASNDMFYAGVPNRPNSVKSAPVEPGSNILTIPTAALHKSPETREAMVEALAIWAAAYPCIYGDLYVNFDCDKGSLDLCEDLMGFLCRNAYPDSATWSTASVPPLCLEAVLSGLSALVETSHKSFDKDDEISEVLASKVGKAIESQVADSFNKSPAKGIADMVKYKLIPSEEPKDVAQFLMSCKKLNKAVLGKYFAKSENKDVLENYVNEFDFRGLRIDEALRLLLCSFRLPGESAQIENLLQKFADHYIASGDKVEDSSDSAFILAYAVLMLNTDHFSPTLKRRMDYDAFLRNVKGVNKALPDEYVQEIFNGITTQEIIMPEEHDTDETFEHSWRENVLGLQPTPDYNTRIRRADVSQAVFESCWKPLVSTLSFVFATATDDLVFRRVITGFHQLAQLATQFKSQSALNHIIACLSHISILSSGDISFHNSNIEVRIESEASVIVSDLSTEFGSDLKAQMASITLFSITRMGASVVGPSAFGLIAKALTNLYIYGLIVPTRCIDIEPIPSFHTFERPKSGKSVGIFSALSSYLTSSADTPDEPSDESVDISITAADCIKACDIENVLKDLSTKASRNFCLGILEIFPEEKDPRYAPTQEFLLKVLNYCAQENSDIRKIAADKAVALNYNSVALELAPDDYALHVLSQFSFVDNDTVKAIVHMPPSPQVWEALETVDNPDSLVWKYISDNSSDITLEDLPNVLKTLEKLVIDTDGLGVQSLEKLAKKFRHESTVYTKILAILGGLSGSGDGKTRENALSVLQTELLQEDQEITWAGVVQNVLLPHVFEVILKPEVWKRDPKGMEWTRQQVASLVGKVFLHLSISLNKVETDEDTDAWIDVLKTLDRLLSSRRQPALEEAIVEMLKNVILVTKLSSKGTDKFWSSTDKVLRGFLPEVAEILEEKEPETENIKEEANPNTEEDKDVAGSSSVVTESDEVQNANEEKNEDPSKDSESSQ